MNSPQSEAHCNRDYTVECWFEINSALVVVYKYKETEQDMVVSDYDTGLSLRGFSVQSVVRFMCTSALLKIKFQEFGNPPPHVSETVKI
jgi:hypothetical protein